MRYNDGMHTIELPTKHHMEEIRVNSWVNEPKDIEEARETNVHILPTI